MAVLLQASGVPFLALDTDPKRVAYGRSQAHAVSFGDVADPELHAALRLERAALVILTVDGAETALRAVTLLGQSCPQVPVLARARDVQTSARLLEAGALHAYPETIEASLHLGTSALQMLQVPPRIIEEVIQNVRDWGYRPVLDPTQDR